MNYNQRTNRDFVKIALVAALYVAVTLMLAPFSFGAIQIRLSEMFNFLVLFQRKYIWGITLGVVISNFASPFGIIDVLVGGAATFLVLGLTIILTRYLRNLAIKLWVTVVIFSLSMCTVAFELMILTRAPFLETYLFVAVGEFISMTIGAFIILLINQKMDIEKLIR